MTNDFEKTSCVRTSSGLEDFIIYGLCTGKERDVNRNTAVLLVSDSSELEAVSTPLIKSGYMVVSVPSLTLAYKYLGKSYVDAVLIDVSGKLPKTGDGYRPGTGEVYTFVKGVRSIDDTLGIFLIDTKSQPWEFNLPVQELTQLNVESSIGQHGLRPFNLSEIKDPENQFYLKLTKRLKERVQSQDVILTEIAKNLLEMPRDGELPFHLGEAAANFYRRNPFGGVGFSIDTDSISIGGAVTPIQRTKQYPEGTRTIHIKSMSPKEAVDFARTHAFLIEKNADFNTPSLFGYHIRDDKTAFAILTFIIGSNYSDIANVLSPDSLNYSGNNATMKTDRALWDSMLDLLLKEKLPEWHKMTHDIVMSDEYDYPNARANISRSQMAQMQLLPSRLADITGKGFTSEELAELHYTIDLLFTAGRGGGKVKKPNDNLLVLPVDPKGSNMAFENFISLPDINAIRSRYLAGGKSPDSKRMSEEFALWGHSMLCEVNPILVGIFQALNDPSLFIPEVRKPQLLFESLERMLPGEDLRLYFDDIFVQGIYKAVLKTYVTASHAQVNEFRKAVAKNRDYGSYASTQIHLQKNFRHFIDQTLKHISLAYTGWREDWRSLPLEQGVERIVEHFSDTERWLRLENGPSKQAQTKSPAYLKRMHQILSKLRGQEFSEFDYPRMMRDALAGTFLKY